MDRVIKEEDAVREWVEGLDLTALSRKTRISLSRIHYFVSGRAKNPSFQVVRALYLQMEKNETEKKKRHKRIWE